FLALLCNTPQYPAAKKPTNPSVIGPDCGRRLGGLTAIKGLELLLLLLFFGGGSDEAMLCADEIDCWLFATTERSFSRQASSAGFDDGARFFCSCVLLDELFWAMNRC